MISVRSSSFPSSPYVAISDPGTGQRFFMDGLVGRFVPHTNLLDTTTALQEKSGPKVPLSARSSPV